MKKLHITISRWSKEKNEKKFKYFRSSVSESVPCEWTLRRITDHLSLFTALESWSDTEARNEFTRDIADFHEERRVWIPDKHEDYDTFKGTSIEKF